MQKIYFRDIFNNQLISYLLEMDISKILAKGCQTVKVFLQFASSEFAVYTRWRVSKLLLRGLL